MQNFKKLSCSGNEMLDIFCIYIWRMIIAPLTNSKEAAGDNCSLHTLHQSNATKTKSQQQRADIEIKNVK